MGMKISAFLLALVAYVYAYPNGAPMVACTEFYPVGHNASALNSNENVTNPFMLELSKTSVLQGESITVLLYSENNAIFYEGFFLVAVMKTAPTEIAGMFEMAPNNSDWQNEPCSNSKGEKASVTHNSSSKKYNHTLTWVAPASMVGEFCLRGAIVHETDEWYLIDEKDGYCINVEAKSNTVIDDPNGANNMKVTLALVSSFAAAIYMWM